MKASKNQLCTFLIVILTILLISSTLPAQSLTPKQQAQGILNVSGVQGGLIVQVGCGDGRLTAALRANDSYLVQGLDRSESSVQAARAYLQSLGIYGVVSVEKLESDRLPYIDNLVNLVVSEDLGAVPMSEVMRVLCPNGVAYIKSNGRWTKTVKPRPKDIDEWTHDLHDASNNAVAHDTVIGPPRRMQWVGSPRYSRHHDRMSSVSAVVSAGGRVFYIFDEAPDASILIPSQWALIARDAFNGTILWKRRIKHWFTQYWPLKSGPAELPRRLVAEGDRVYVTLALDAPLTALDAATGRTVRTYEGTTATEEVIFSNGVLFALVNNAADKPDYDGSARFARGYSSKFWNGAPRKIMAIRADTGQVLWTVVSSVLPGTLAADDKHVVFHDGNDVVCLDRNTGRDLWRSQPVARAKEIHSFYLPTLVLYKDVVLFSGGETAGLQTGSWYTTGKDTMTALSAKTGDVLWAAYHPPSGYRSPEDLLVASGLVWTGATTSGRATGVFTGRNPETGAVESQFAPDVHIYWFHHRCYRGKATDNYLLTSRAGTEFIDVHNQHWIANHWTRGACLYGVMPANGLLYSPPHPCACYLESKQYGFSVLAPASAGPRVPPSAANEVRLEKGPAYGREISAKSGEQEWPTYRHDAARSGLASTSVPAVIKQAWAAKIGGKLTSLVVADGKLFVASVNAHTLYALDAASGGKLWQYTTGARIDSPPTIYQGRVLFGSTDGCVYCLDASDGALAWRYRAAPMDQRLMAFEQLESVWPVHGSVLVENGVLYCVAGRSMFLDSGLRLLRLDPKTGRLLSRTVLGDHDAATGKSLQDYVSWLDMPPALPDILSSDGRLVYMRSQPYHLDGTRLPLKKMAAGSDADRGAPPVIQNPEHAHLFSPTGFLDDAYWHRSYWMYGSTFVSGWCGYYLAGKVAPAGKILVDDDSKVYGFGRKPQYYRWTTPIEFQLFAADKSFGVSTNTRRGPKRSLVSVEKSRSLNPAGKPLTVEAWVKAEKPGGVIVAQGGSSQGYVLYLRKGQPCFTIRAGGEAASVTAKANVGRKWVHLAGVLTGTELQIYVNGDLAGTAKAPGYITANPQEAMQIGADEGSTVDEYVSPFGFKGLIDEVRVYHRALNAAEIKRNVSNPDQVDEAGLVLRYSFDKGDASDTSGNHNDGTLEGAVPVEGKIGRAMKFTGGVASVPGYDVKDDWTVDVPQLTDAMVLAGGTLFIAGPPDLVDEQQAFRQIHEPAVQRALAQQEQAIEGHKGALLMAVSASDGHELARYNLDYPPVFDGMIAASGRLYVATKDGRVLCFGPNKK
jgi:outer membrane protein assembly factor BamB